MGTKTKLLLAILLGLLIGSGASAILPLVYKFPTTGDIATIELSVKWLNGTEVTNINWGVVENSTADIMEPLKVTNIGKVAVTLALSTATLSPSILSLTLTWNYTGAVLQPNNSATVELTQTVTATGPYTYETVITATEA